MAIGVASAARRPGGRVRADLCFLFSDDSTSHRGLTRARSSTELHNLSSCGDRTSVHDITRRAVTNETGVVDSDRTTVLFAQEAEMRLLSLSIFAALTITACATGTPDVTPDPDQNPPVETGPRYITLDHDALETAQEALAQRDPGAKLDMIDMWN